MSGSGALPEFVREAVLADESAPQQDEPAPGGARDGLSAEGGAAAAERSLLALEDALSDVVQVETTHVRVPASLLERGPARLLQSALEPPLRYAPLFSRVARFLDLTEDTVMLELTRSSEPARWSATGVPGVATMPLRRGPGVRSATASLIRIDPGACLRRGPPLRLQRVLVLEGRVENSRGDICRPGDVSEWGPGVYDSLSAAAGQRCILASLVFGLGLRGWFERVFAAVSAR